MLVQKSAMPYDVVMEWSLREVRVFVIAADAGSFTDAAARLFISQAAVSRTIANLERGLGVQLLRRIPTGCVPTVAGQQLLPAARRMIAEADRFTEFARSRRPVLRLGYAWAALGVHTARLQREWARAFPEIDLELLRLAELDEGLASGECDAVISRRSLDVRRFTTTVIGREERRVAIAADDEEWGRRRALKLDEIASRVVAIDERYGTTDAGLFDGHGTPALAPTRNVDEWLDLIAAGRAVGITAEATSHHHQRDGVRFLRIADAVGVSVLIGWRQGDPPAGLDHLVDLARHLYAP